MPILFAVLCLLTTWSLGQQPATHKKPDSHPQKKEATNNPTNNQQLTAPAINKPIPTPSTDRKAKDKECCTPQYPQQWWDWNRPTIADYAIVILTLGYLIATVFILLA